MNPAFLEVQKFRQWWLWVFLIGLNLLPVYGIIKQVFNGTPWGSKPMSDAGLFLFFLFTLAFTYFFVGYLELRTEIDAKGIRVRLRGVDTKILPWDAIASTELISYGFVGYGLRLLTRHGTVYNISGNKGLAIRCKDGSRYLVGTQNPEQLRSVLKALSEDDHIPFTDQPDSK